MDFRPRTTVQRARAGRCPCCGHPLRSSPTHRVTILGAVTLFAFTAIALTLPLAFPNLIKVWLAVNVLLALLAGLLVAYLTTRPADRTCTNCNPTPGADTIEPDTQAQFLCGRVTGPPRPPLGS